MSSMRSGAMKPRLCSLLIPESGGETGTQCLWLFLSFSVWKNNKNREVATRFVSEPLASVSRAHSQCSVAWWEQKTVRSLAARWDTSEGCLLTPGGLTQVYRSLSVCCKLKVDSRAVPLLYFFHLISPFSSFSFILLLRLEPLSFLRGMIDSS